MTDNIAPNYVRINPDGTVSAVFNGGVVLTSWDEVTSPSLAESEIVWQRQSDGAVLAQILSEQNTITKETVTTISSEGPDVPNTSAFISLGGNVAGGAGYNYIELGAGTHTLNALNGDGTSDLLQKANNLTDLASSTKALASLGLVTDEGSGAGNLAYTVRTAETGLNLVHLRAIGPNIDHTIAYLWMVPEGNVQSLIMQIANGAYLGNQVWGVGWGSAVNFTPNQGAVNLSYVGGGNSNEMGISAGGGTTEYAWSIVRLSQAVTF